jgi:glutaconate CoA-transferase subunit A
MAPCPHDAAVQSECWSQRLARCSYTVRVTLAMECVMSESSPGKLVTLDELARRIPDGAALGLGGVFLHRGPFALVRELARQTRRHLDIIKPSPGYDVDLLCRAGAVARVRAGIVAMEGPFGLARWYRRAIERKEARLEEHA